MNIYSSFHYFSMPGSFFFFQTGNWAEALEEELYMGVFQMFH